MYISKKYSEKLEKHLRHGLLWKLWDYIAYIDHSLLKVKSNCFARNSTQVKSV